jgi:hypothetical protein
MRSGFFKTLFSLPRNPHDLCLEGTNDDHPVVLHGIEQSEFDSLLSYMIGGWASKGHFCISVFALTVCMHRYSPELYQVEAMMSVLKLSVFLEVKDGEDWALAELPRLEAFSPSLQLEVARKYRVDHWVEPAFRELMRIPLQNFDLTDVFRIGLQYYAILVNTKARIDDHRRNIAFRAPDVVNDIFCKRKAACGISWNVEWWSGIGKQLLHPDAALTGREVLAGLDSVRLPRMCLDCQQQSIDWVKATGVLAKEEKMVDEALGQVMGLQTDEPIRASMRNIILPGI